MKRNKYEEPIVNSPDKYRLAIQWKSDENFPDCSHVEIEISERQIELIKTALKMAHTDGIDSVNAGCIVPVKFLIEMEEGVKYEEDKEYRSGSEYFLCFDTDTIYFRSDCKHSSNIIESEAFVLTD